ncbi:MAG TPA: hypothetical protein VGD64_14280 [Acidisarcina sp.]
MRLLFVIFVLSVAALIWTAFGIACHIRRHHLAPDLPKETDLARETESWKKDVESAVPLRAEKFMPAAARKHS